MRHWRILSVAWWAMAGVAGAWAQSPPPDTPATAGEPALVRPSPARAECTDPDECVAVGRWQFGIALGAGVRTDPLISSRNIPLVLIPSVSYYGQRFFLHDLDVGFTLWDNRRFAVNLLASPGYDRAYFFRADLQNFFVAALASPVVQGQFGVSGYDAHRPYQVGTTATLAGLPANAQPLAPRTPAVTYLAGPELTVGAGAFNAQVTTLHEVTGHSEGNELRFAVNATLPRALRDWSVATGLTWKDASTVNFFYGVPGVYRPGGAIVTFGRLGFRHALDRHWRLEALAEYSWLGPAIERSPLIRTDRVMTAFAGAAYSF